MSDKQNHGPDKDSSSPASDEHSRDQNKSPAKSYYYDDATGYEIYTEESDDADEEENRAN